MKAAIQNPIPFDVVRELLEDKVYRNVRLRYPHLQEPDDYLGKLSYKTGIILTEEQKEELEQRCIEIREQFIADGTPYLVTGRKKKLTKKQEAGLEIMCDFSFEDLEDGTWSANCKLNAERKGALIVFPLVDAKRKPVPSSVTVGGGSVGNVKITLWPWFTFALGWGVQFRLQAVQVIEVANINDRALADFEVEDGFTTGAEESPDDDGDAGDADF